MSETSAQPDHPLAIPYSSEEALRAVLESRTFARSEKLQRFLKYVCEMSFRGAAGQLHEHLIAVEVFGRGEDYSPGEDSIVRRQAHALRRKLKEYYETEGREDSVQIDLPVGTYVPSFRERPRPERGAEEDSPEKRKQVRKAGWPLSWLAGAAALALAAVFWAGWTARGGRAEPPRMEGEDQAPLRELWGPWLSNSSGVVLCFSSPSTTSVRRFTGPLEPNPEHQGLGVNAAQDTALRSFFSFPAGGKVYLYPLMAQAKMGEAQAAVSLSVFFTRAGLPVQTTQSRFMTWDVMRKSNVILLGHADSNPWVEQVLKSAPLTLAPTDQRRRARILNRAPGDGEQAEYFPTLPGESKSYALLSFLPAVDGAHETLVIGGLDTSSTTGAVDFLLSPKSGAGLLERLKALAPNRKGPWHFQAVLETDVRDTVPVKAWVVALKVL